MEYPLRYPKPKILLLDMPRDCENVLKAAGYNVKAGSFGIPCRVEPSSTLHYVNLRTCKLPNLQEQEVVIANLAHPASVLGPQGESPGVGVNAVWQNGTQGETDPRPCAMLGAMPHFSQIHEAGGVFIVFLDNKYTATYIRGFPRGYSTGPVEPTDHFQCSNWSFLPVLDSFTTERARGEEITFGKRMRELCDILIRGAAGAEYFCTIEPHYRYQSNWHPLATNKYGRCVAGLLAREEPKRHVLLLPQMPEADKILVELVEDWCSLWNPSIFPHLEGAKWVQRKEYEIPRAVELAEQIEATQEKAKERVAEPEEGD